MNTSVFNRPVGAVHPVRSSNAITPCVWSVNALQNRVSLCTMFVILLFFAASGINSHAEELSASAPSAGIMSAAYSTYRLGAGDVISVAAIHVDELNNRTLTVGDDGSIRLPQYGVVPVVGLTIREAEAAVKTRLQPYFRMLEVTINIVDYGSRPVSVLGAVNKPGVYHLKGPQRLVEVLSLAGGPRQDAGYRVTVTRRASEGGIPIDSASRMADVFVADVNLTDIMTTKNPAANIVIRANDVISVPQARMVYVIGDVRKSGGFVLGDQEDLSVLQALSLAEGLMPTAAAGSARILRQSPEGKRDEIAVDVKKLLTGRTADIAMHPEDILFIPGSSGKKAALRVLDTAIQIGTGVVIWRR